MQVEKLHGKHLRTSLQWFLCQIHFVFIFFNFSVMVPKSFQILRLHLFGDSLFLLLMPREATPHIIKVLTRLRVRPRVRGMQLVLASLVVAATRLQAQCQWSERDRKDIEQVYSLMITHSCKSIVVYSQCWPAGDNLSLAFKIALY